MLEAVGLALYGEDWINVIAYEFDINKRSIFRWLGGTSRPIELLEDHGIFNDLLEALNERVTELTQAKTMLKDWMDDRQLPN